MKNTQNMARLTRFGMIALLAVTALLTVAHAQSLPATPSATQLENLHAGNGAGLSSDGFRQPWSIGWNYVHPQYCTVYYSGGYAYEVIYVSGGYFWTTDDRFQQLIAPACQTGNWLAFYVYDGNNDWSQVWTYTYK
jgi:hypothetical protein